MIIDFDVNCNKYNDKILNNYTILSYTCPSCGAKHSFIRHACYERNLCFLDIFNNVHEEKMTILRLKCKSCGHTHAVLPNDVIPYCIYTCSYIINALTKYFEGKKVLDICDNLNISFQLLYHFISRFLDFLDSCFIVLRNLGIDNLTNNPHGVLSAISVFNKQGNFFKQYFFSTKWMFLMKNFQNILAPKIWIGSS